MRQPAQAGTAASSPRKALTASARRARRFRRLSPARQFLRHHAPCARRQPRGARSASSSTRHRGGHYRVFTVRRSVSAWRQCCGLVMRRGWDLRVCLATGMRRVSHGAAHPVSAKERTLPSSCVHKLSAVFHFRSSLCSRRSCDLLARPPPAGDAQRWMPTIAQLFLFIDAPPEKSIRRAGVDGSGFSSERRQAPRLSMSASVVAQACAPLQDRRTALIRGAKCAKEEHCLGKDVHHAHGCTKTPV